MFNKLLIGFILVLLDVVSKLFFVRFFPSLVYHNTGSAFSLAVPLFVTIPLSIIFVCGCIWVLWRKKLAHDFIWILALAGACGNLIDRVSYGYVVDFINLHFWPVFNFADIYLSVATLSLAYFYVIKNEK